MMNLLDSLQGGDGDEGKSSFHPSQYSDSKAVERDTAGEAALVCENLKNAGNEALKNKDYNKAIELYGKALALSPDNFPCLSNRSLAHLKAGKYTEAEDDATRLLSECPVSESTLRSKALFRRALARRGRAGPGDLMSALSDLDLLLVMEPGNKEAMKEKLQTDALLEKEKARDKVLSKSSAVPPSEQVKPTRRVEAAGVPSVSSGIAVPMSSDGEGIGIKERSTTKRIIKSTEVVNVEQSQAQSGHVSQKPEAVAVSDGSLVQEITRDPAVTSSGLGSSKKSKKVPLNSTSVATAAKAVLPATLAPGVPTEPPKTVYELERVWRSLRARPELLAQYMKCFKHNTISKVLKETTSPELLSSLLHTMRDQLLLADPAHVQYLLEGISKLSRFGMLLSLLPEADLKCLKSTFDTLVAIRLQENNGGEVLEKLRKLKLKYGF